MSDPQPTPYPEQGPGRPAPKRLTRSRDDKMVGGVCGGFARYLNVDATLIRVLMVLALVVGFLTPALAYLVAWALMPEE